MAADGFGDRVAVGPREGGITYRELQAQAGHLARELSESESERVGFLGLTSAAVPQTLFACARAGKPFMPLNYRWPDSELADAVDRGGLRLAVVDADMACRLEVVDGLELIEASAEPGAPSEADSPDSGIYPADPDAIAVLLPTSGTTGGPKTAVLRHRNLAGYVMGTVDFMSAEIDECTLVSVPPYHIAGIAAAVSSVYAGRRMVHLGAFDPQRWIETVRRESVTHAMVVPTMLARIVDALREHPTALPTLGQLSYGGGRMPIDVVEAALDLLPKVDFVNAYGLTETSSTIALLTPDDHRTSRASANPGVRRRLSSVGRALPTVEIEIRDEAGHALAAGTAGEIYVRGPQVSGQYLERDAIGADGWFATRDAGTIDADGYLYVDGRLDDIIVRGGENISPSEVEDVLNGHAGIRESAVFGVLDDEWGERIAAAVVRRPATAEVSEQELRELVRSQLRSNRVPDLIVFRESLPYGETGKLLRRVLRAEMSVTTHQ
jgi:fatty-acyl-CoA synthase